jgi:regulator of sirC expression with transglutaminase-like and TPR domain
LALQHDRLEELIHDIQFEIVSDELAAWVSSVDQDLLLGFYILSKYFSPDLNYDVVQKQVFKIRQSIWLELNYNQTPLEQIQIFNQIFYGFHGFNGIQLSERFDHYTLHNLLDTKYGASIALGILYQIVARDLNLPV